MRDAGSAWSLVTAGVLAVVLVACADPVVEGEVLSADPVPSDTATSDPDSSDSDPSDPDPSDPVPSDPPTADGDAVIPGTCPDGLADELDALVASQLVAFAADDWVAALSLASDEFRIGFDADRLRATIEEGFPAVADAVGHRSAVCRYRPPGNELAAVAALDVTVTGIDGDVEELRYLFVRDPRGWGIAGAGPIDAGTTTA